MEVKGEQEAGVWDLIQEAGVEILGFVAGMRELEFYFLLFCFLFYFIWQMQRGKERYDQRRRRST